MIAWLPSAPTLSGLPARCPGTAVRIVATNDLLATFEPLSTTYGHTGSVPLIQELVDLEREDGPTLWLDAGDLSANASRTFIGIDWPLGYAGVRIDAAAAGNHEFDDPRVLAGLDHTLRFPLLCADREVDLPPSTLLSTAAGTVGVIGVSHPDSDLLAAAPARRADWTAALVDEAAGLRDAGARWVVALWHCGVTWSYTGVRADAWEAETGAVATAFDLILGGHTLTSWSGTLNQVPAGQAHGFAGSLVVVDLPHDGPAHIHPPHLLGAGPDACGNESSSSGRVDALRMQLRSWQRTPVGHLPTTLTMRPGETNTLGDFVAAAWLDQVADADAAFVPACDLWTQPPVDGTVAALPAGEVTELDLRRLFPFDDTLVLLELQAGEWEALVSAHDHAVDFANTSTDTVWWNWARGRAGVAQATDSPRRVVTSQFAATLLGDADSCRHATNVRAAAAVEAVLGR